MRIFLAGPFTSADVLAILLGRPVAADELRTARLEDHAVMREARGLRAALVPAPGARTPGVLVDGSGDARARITFAMRAMGAGPKTRAASPPIEFHAGPGFEGGLACDAAPDIEWSTAFPEFLAEIMDHFEGRGPDADLDPILVGIAIRALARVRGAARVPACRHGAALDAGDVVPGPRRIPYADYFAVEDYRLHHRRFAGGWSGGIDRAVLASGDGVTVLPFDPQRGKVLLVEQFRIGAMARKDPRPWLLEAVAGRCDALESPEDAARRETREEAGITLGRLERAMAYYTTPGVCTEYLTAFIGEADLAGAGGIFGLDSENEDIRTLVLTLDAALDAVEAGEINNAPLILSLLWLARNRSRLEAAWR